MKKNLKTKQAKAEKAKMNNVPAKKKINIVVGIMVLTLPIILFGEDTPDGDSEPNEDKVNSILL